MSGPKLTDEDRAVLEKMLANREKERQRQAEQGPPKSLPADSPIHKKWQSNSFLGLNQADTSDDELAWQLEQLGSSDPRSRAYILRTIAANPVPDTRLLAASEQLLDDRAITLLNIPPLFGEVRWIAAEAVAALRGALGHGEAVTVEDTFEPVSDVDQLARDAGMEPLRRDGIQGPIETLEQLSAMGLLPRRRITLDPKAPMVLR